LLCPPPPPPPPPAPSAESARTGTQALAPGTHTLTVENGRGSGRYEAGDLVTVTADAPPPGKKFVGWSGDTQILANPFISPTKATAVSKDVKIKATYADK
jgi:Divergent InlB B-repeat domain